MPAPISVVIPTLNAAEALPETLGSLMDGVSAGLIRELIITDGGSDDATLRLAEDAGARWVAGQAGRGGQLRRGCAEACGEWLLILHADTHLSPGWAAAVQPALRAGERAHCFELAFRATGLGARWTAGWANLRTRLFGLPYGDQGLLIPQTLYTRAGGYPDIPLMEDVALVRALPEPPRLLPAVARTSAARYLEEGWIRRGSRNLRTLLRYRAGVSPERLAEAYRKR